MTPAFKLLAFVTTRNGPNRRPAIHNRFTKTLVETPNDYNFKELPVIPAGTVIQMDFGGDFGMYGIADIQGTLHRVKIDLNDLNKLDWSDYQDEINS